MEKDLWYRLRNSILLTLSVYCGLEWVVFHIISQVYQFNVLFYFLFVAIQFFFHIGIFIFLSISKNFFYIVDTKKPLHRVNLANKITLLRISMLPSLVFLIIAVKQYPVGSVLLSAIGLTFITDLIDGRISRSFHQVTFIGKVLDSVSDYSLLLVIGIAYFIYALIPLWLFTSILVRLLFQAFGMLVLLIKHKSVEPKPTIVGKITVASIMIIFALEPLKLVFAQNVKAILGIMELLVCIIVYLSLLDKAWYFYKQGILKRTQ